jgi:hypothetical protein
MTNPFGYYRFFGLHAGQTYTFAPRSKQFNYAVQQIAIDEVTFINISP